MEYSAILGRRLSTRATDEQLSPGAIAGVVIGSIFACLLILGIAYGLLVCFAPEQPITFIKPGRSTYVIPSGVPYGVRCRHESKRSRKRAQKEHARQLELAKNRRVWCSRYEHDGRLKYLALITMGAKYELEEMPDRPGHFSHRMTRPWTIDQERSTLNPPIRGRNDRSVKQNLKFMHVAYTIKTSEAITQRYQEIIATFGTVDSLSWSQCHDFLRRFTDDVTTLGWTDVEFDNDLHDEELGNSAVAPTWNVILANREQRRPRIEAERVARLEAQRIEWERNEAERWARDKAERIERERIAAELRAKLEAERAERERIAAERREQRERERSDGLDTSEPSSVRPGHGYNHTYTYSGSGSGGGGYDYDNDYGGGGDSSWD
jgi:hypothetical protein